jgi:hypothetical protein
MYYKLNYLNIAINKFNNNTTVIIIKKTKINNVMTDPTLVGQLVFALNV